MTELPSYKVTKLRAGTVIDHLAPGNAMVALKILGLPKADTVAIGLNFPSAKHGVKDLIKVENRFLTPEEISKLSLVCPRASISYIRDFDVVEKLEARIPDDAIGLVRCPNPGCITNHEQVTTRFSVTASPGLRLQCHYCERSFGRDKLIVL
jgi:aspartate carbamoyltransferase regulatory subunit